jgi:hypothetical protein
MAPLRVDATSGSTPGAAGSFDPGTTTTVKIDETDLGQVANRLGVPKHDLLQANPQIKDPSKLVAGQDIHLPQNQGLSTSANDVPPQPRKTVAGGSDKAPLTDPVIKNVVESKLDAAASAPATPPATQTPVAESQGGVTGLLNELKFRAEMQKIKDEGQDLVNKIS